VFAALIVVGVMGVGMYAIFDFFERRMTGWSVRGGGAQHFGGG
jgi:NitT/TauT family transport system permease protein